MGDLMPKKIETSLIIRKETKFDYIRKKLLMLFFGKESKTLGMFDELIVRKNNIDKNKIIIPKEIQKQELWHQ